MISVPSLDAKVPARFAQAPWNERTAFWRQLHAQLPPDHKARSQFSKDRFKWHGNLDAYECPAGHLLKRVSGHTRVCSGGREGSSGSTGARHRPAKLVRCASSVRRVKQGGAVCSGVNMKS